MPGLAVRTVRRMSLAAALALLPAACAAPGEHWGTQPEDSLRMGAAMTPGSSGLGNYLAALHAHSQRNGGAAAKFYTTALDKDPDNIELLQRAFTLMLAEGRVGEAADLARRLANYDPNASIAVMLLAMQDAKAGNFAAAERRLEALPKRGINAFVGPLLTAWTRVGQRRTDEALQVLSPLANNSHLAALHDFHAGLITDLVERDMVAGEYYRNAVASPGGLTVRTVEAVGAFYQRQGRIDKARELYDSYGKEHPDSALFDAEAMLALGRKAPRVVSNAGEGLAEALFGTASSLRQGNAPEAALIFVQMALDLRPDCPLARMLLADILQSQGRLAEANAAFSAVSRDSPLWWSAQLRVAGNLDALGDVDGAARLLRTLGDAYPRRPEALVTLGELLRKHERYGEAVAAYDGALQRIGTPAAHDWALFYSRGIALERSGEWTRAESDFLKALELAPDQPHVLNYLGYSWVEKGINLPQARRMIEKAVELRPGDGYILDSLGWVLYRLGEYDDAVRHLERAAELKPEDPTINDHLGDALWRVGRLDEARYQWQRALLLAKEPHLIEAVKAKIAAGLAGSADAGR